MATKTNLRCTWIAEVPDFANPPPHIRLIFKQKQEATTEQQLSNKYLPLLTLESVAWLSSSLPHDVTPPQSRRTQLTDTPVEGRRLNLLHTGPER